MKQFFKMFFASLLGVIVASVIVLGIGIGMIVNAVKSKRSPQSTARVEEASILLIETGRRMHEQGREDPFAAFTQDASSSAGLFDAIRAIQAAKKDDNIKAILLKLEGGSNGWATMQQVREALVDFKQSGKKVYAYGEGISQRDYYIATAADVLYLNPAGMMELKGLSTQLAFFKGTLEKLGIQPEIFYAGRFKSATEPFRSDRISEANRIRISEMQRDIWSSFLQAAAAKAKTDTATIHRLASVGGIYFASDALKAGLIDGAGYWDQMEALMRPIVNKKGDEKLTYISINKYASRQGPVSGSGDARIAVLYAEGEIVDGPGTETNIGSEAIVRSIRQIRRNDRIKAVVLRVNSPGGSALASEVILRELQLLKAKKPLIVSMGDLAASGGYYIAAGADSIFAMPNTLTGSIGVFGMLFDVSAGLRDKLGVTTDEVKNAPLADFPTVSRALTPAEAARMQATIDTIYSTFKSRVAAGRRMTPIMVDSIAQGRVWTGTDALGIGLVDGLGGMDRALKSAAARAKLSEYKVVTYPEPVDRFNAMMSRIRRSPLSAASMEEAISRELRENFAVYEQLEWLRRISGKAQMMMPFRPEFN